MFTSTNKQLEQLVAELKTLVRDVPDFPVPGILFKDLTTVFKNPDSLQVMADALADIYADCGVYKVLGIESRGFIMGSVLANRLHAGFVPVRKPGKLPADTLKMEYEKEYGTDVIEIHKDAITSDDVVILHDDLLATGGTMRAAYELLKQFNPRAIYINFVCSIPVLKGREVLPAGVPVTTLFDFG